MTCKIYDMCKNNVPNKLIAVEACIRKTWYSRLQFKDSLKSTREKQLWGKKNESKTNFNLFEPWKLLKISMQT